MIAFQGVEATSLKDFDFVNKWELRPYDNDKEPVVVFGGPRYSSTRRVIQNHKGVVIIRWTGSDARKIRKYKELITRMNVINVTPLVKAREILIENGIPCYLINGKQGKPPVALKRGNKIYTYIHHKNPVKYGKHIIDTLDVPYDLLIADLKIPKKDWYAGKCDELYSQCFIGLALSDFTGGGGSAMEMGLRGIRVVTNVIKGAHVINWQTKKDVEKSIMIESKNIGTKDQELADAVYNEKCECEGFDLNKLIL